MSKKPLIGLTIEIIDSSNQSQKGIKGKIVDETKNTLTIHTNKDNKKLIKNQITIIIDEKIIKGKDLVGKPEERIKKSR